MPDFQDCSLRPCPEGLDSCLMVTATEPPLPASPGWCWSVQWWLIPSDRWMVWKLTWNGKTVSAWISNIRPRYVISYPGAVRVAKIDSTHRLSFSWSFCLFNKLSLMISRCQFLWSECRYGVEELWFRTIPCWILGFGILVVTYLSDRKVRIVSNTRLDIDHIPLKIC